MFPAIREGPWSLRLRRVKDKGGKLIGFEVLNYLSAGESEGHRDTGRGRGSAWLRAGKPNQNAQVVPLTTPKGVSHNHTDGVRIADELVSQIAALRAGMSGTERLIP